MDGTWGNVLEEAAVTDDVAGVVERVISVDSTSARAHHHAADARKRGAALDRSRPPQW